jgi:drug/metabolite transporter (DMT)-like permease
MWPWIQLAIFLGGPILGVLLIAMHHTGAAPVAVVTGVLFAGTLIHARLVLRTRRLKRRTRRAERELRSPTDE